MPTNQHNRPAHAENPAPTWHWVMATLLITVGVTLLRLVLNLRHALPPGMDAGYYPLQTRSLLERGELMGSTPPLIFWLDAGLTRGLLLLTDLSVNQAAILATRLVDSMAHPWLAVPVMLLGRRWTGGRRSGLMASACCSALAVCSPPVMRMVSDFQKNSLGLVWLGFSLWAMCESLHRPRLWRWGLVLLFVTLAGLSHIGAFGVTCVALAGMLTGEFLLAGKRPGGQLLRTIVVLFVAVVPAAGIVYWLAPQWAEHLWAMPSRAMGMLDFRLHPGMVLLSLFVWTLLALLSVCLWRQRRESDVADAAVACGCVAALVVLTVPVLDATWTMRFQLMIPLPAAVLLLFSVTRLQPIAANPAVSRWLIRGTAVTVVCSPFFMQGPVITSATAAELQAFAGQLDDPGRTLVVAPHGLEFWVGLMTNAEVTSVGLPDERGSFEHILIVNPHRGPLSGSGPPEHRGPPARGDWRGPQRRSPGRDRHHGPDDQIVVPDGAQRIHRGENFDVFEVL